MSTLTETDDAIDAAISRAFTRGPAELVDDLSDAEYERLANAIRAEVLRAMGDRMTLTGDTAK